MAISNYPSSPSASMCPSLFFLPSYLPQPQSEGRKPALGTAQRGRQSDSHAQPKDHRSPARPSAPPQHHPAERDAPPCAQRTRRPPAARLPRPPAPRAAGKVYPTPDKRLLFPSVLIIGCLLKRTSEYRLLHDAIRCNIQLQPQKQCGSF